MAVSISVWLKAALAHTPGAHRPVVREQFFETVREFYSQSTALREAVVRDVVADTSEYTILPDTAGLETQNILDVVYDGNPPLGKLTRRPSGAYLTGDAPTRWYLTGRDVVNLWPQPNLDLDDGLTIYIVAAPVFGATSLPDIAKSDHYDALLDGLLGRLHGQPAKPYSDPVRAQYRLKRFRAAIGRFSGLAKVGNVATAAGWSFPRFGK